MIHLRRRYSLRWHLTAVGLVALLAAFLRLTPDAGQVAPLPIALALVVLFVEGWTTTAPTRRPGEWDPTDAAELAPPPDDHRSPASSRGLRSSETELMQ